MKFFRSGRGVVASTAVVLGLMFLIRPGANRLRNQIVHSISLALGRPVEVASVHLQLLPRPGFHLKNFVVHEDPAFGAEPMLRADEVTASLRISSLLRGRLEIARLDLTDPSLNLVHSAGHWNIESLIERAEKIPVAPTAKPGREKRPGFPYIDCSSGRINFKSGLEKRPYALTDADFALWQDSDNAWGMRLKARPVRTDLNLTDTGVLQVTGAWQRAAELHDTPLKILVNWQGAQLGQLTKLRYGDDKGWRGSIRISASVIGTPISSNLALDASADDFRRYDVLGADKLNLAGHCDAQYSSMNDTLTDIHCSAPVGNGIVAVRGQAKNPLNERSYELVVTAQGVPMESLLSVIKHAKNGVPDDLAALGQVDAEFRGERRQGASASWHGYGQTSRFQLKSQSTHEDVAFGEIPFDIASKESKPVQRQRNLQVNTGPDVEVGPFHAALGSLHPATLQGRVGRDGYDFQIRGEGQIPQFLHAAHMVGISAPYAASAGMAKIDLTISEKWRGSEHALITGTAQLHSVRAQIRGFNAPIEIASTNVTFTPERLNVQNLTVSAAGTTWSGSLNIARPCAMMPSCTVQFALHAKEIDLARLNELLNPEARKTPWYQILSPAESTGSPYLLTVDASGTLNADRAKIGKLEAKRISGMIELKEGKLRVSNLQADVLGGRHSGEWKADFTARPPQYSGSGSLRGLDLAQVAQVMDDEWITGTTTTSYHLNTAGLTATKLFGSATGSIQIEASTGTLAHVVLTHGTSPLQMRHLTADLTLRDGKVVIQTGALETDTEIFRIEGSASLDQVLNLKLTRPDASGFNITGTLAQPRVAQVAAPETRAALKP